MRSWEQNETIQGARKVVRVSTPARTARGAAAKDVNFPCGDSTGMG
jgi:hypothetical protein